VRFEMKYYENPDTLAQCGTTCETMCGATHDYPQSYQRAKEPPNQAKREWSHRRGEDSQLVAQRSMATDLVLRSGRAAHDESDRLNQYAVGDVHVSSARPRRRLTRNYGILAMNGPRVRKIPVIIPRSFRTIVSLLGHRRRPVGRTEVEMFSPVWVFTSRISFISVLPIAGPCSAARLRLRS